MGRSVSTPNNSVAEVYFGCDCEDSWEWDDMVMELKSALVNKYPSFEEADRWLGDEDHVILENKLVEVTLSEYCGLVAVCTVAKEIEPDGFREQCLAGLAIHWAHATKLGIEQAVKDIGRNPMGLVGRFSNGECVYS